IAAAYAIQQDWQNAIVYYSNAINLNPNEASFYEDRAFANYSLKTPEGLQNALNDYTKAEELGVKTTKLYQYRATINGQLGKFDAAVKDYDSYLALNPNDINIIYQRGNAYFKLKKYKETIADMDKVINDEKTSKNVKIQALQRRGASKKELKDLKGAQADMELIKKLKGGN
ncbi:MAG: tetratricopeptide repeat protein, partial [Bacteroidales bacterium]|nr:tetratricopeptide repeat protein [Bacteroidales bacterium]